MNKEHVPLVSAWLGISATSMGMAVCHMSIWTRSAKRRAETRTKHRDRKKKKLAVLRNRYLVSVARQEERGKQSCVASRAAPLGIGKEVVVWQRRDSARSQMHRALVTSRLDLLPLTKPLLLQSPIANLQLPV